MNYSLRPIYSDGYTCHLREDHGDDRDPALLGQIPQWLFDVVSNGFSIQHIMTHVQEESLQHDTALHDSPQQHIETLLNLVQTKLEMHLQQRWEPR